MSFSYSQKKIALLIFTLLIILFREINLFISPRFWAEEGTVYFLNAYSDGIAAILYANQGYFSIIPNIATFFSTLVPLEYAPVPTLIISFLVILIPSILVLSSNSEYLKPIWAKSFAIFIIYFVTNTEEVWLNTITSQFWFLIITFLILIEDKTSPNRNKIYLMLSLSLLSGLSGIPGNLLAPFFLVRFLCKKQKLDLYIFLALLLTIIVQLIFITFTEHHSDRALDTGKLIPAFITSITGVIQYPFIFKSLVDHKTAFIIMSIVIALIINKRNYRNVLFLISIPFFASIIMTFSSLNMSGGGRYFFSVSIIYILTIFYFLRTYKTSKATKIIIYFYIVTALVVGIKKYNFKEGFTTHPNWKVWSEEVKRYNNGEQDSISVYPQWENAYWKINMPNKAITAP